MPHDGLEDLHHLVGRLVPHGGAHVDPRVDTFAYAHALSLRYDGANHRRRVVYAHHPGGHLQARLGPLRVGPVFVVVPSPVHHQRLLEQRAAVLWKDEQPTHGLYKSLDVTHACICGVTGVYLLCNHAHVVYIIQPLVTQSDDH